MKEHGPPAFVKWPELPKHMPQFSTNAPFQDDEGSEVALGLRRRDVRVIQEDAGVGTFSATFEADLVEEEVPKDGEDGETFHMELDQRKEDIGSCYMEQGKVLLLEILIDISRHPFGYDIDWKSEDLDSIFTSGPTLHIEVSEIPPAPTHSATHLQTDGTIVVENAPSAPGDAIGSRLPKSLAALGYRRPRAISLTALKGGVKQHAVRIYMFPERKDISHSPENMSTVDVAVRKRHLRGRVELQFADQSSGREFHVRVAGKKVAVAGVAEALEKSERLKRLRYVG